MAAPMVVLSVARWVVPMAVVSFLASFGAEELTAPPCLSVRLMEQRILLGHIGKILSRTLHEFHGVCRAAT